MTAKGRLEKCRVLIIENLPGNGQIWWRPYVRDCSAWEIDSINIAPKDDDIEKRRDRSEISVLLSITLQIIKAIMRRDYDMVITIQGGRETFILAFIQSLKLFCSSKHVVIDFIMRERVSTLQSRLKYAFMRFCLQSVKLIICSARSEVTYYSREFGWAEGKCRFIPLYVRPVFLQAHAREDGGYVFSSGRTFRDYTTLVEAVRNLPINVLIVAGSACIKGLVNVPSNIRFVCDVSLQEYAKLLAGARYVILPLLYRQISVGQQVLLEAMAACKAVVVTDVPGVRDYLIPDETALTVPPGDVDALRNAIMRLEEDSALISRLGTEGRAKLEKDHVVQRYLPVLSRLMRENH